jgi:hypothetical protein
MTIENELECVYGQSPLLHTDPSGLVWGFNTSGNNGRGEYRWFQGDPRSWPRSKGSFNIVGSSPKRISTHLHLTCIPLF